MNIYGIALLGTPGAGKTTFTTEIGNLFNYMKRKFKVVSLDPASLQEADFDIKSLINVSEVQQFHKIGPNAAVNFCLEFLEANVEILQNFILENEDCYFIFDIPGQVEAYVAHDSLKMIFQKIGVNLGIVFVVDGTQCLSYSKFISLGLQMAAVVSSFPYPFVPILNKVDLLSPEDQHRIENFFEYENDNQIQRFAVRTMMDFSLMCSAYEIKDVAKVIQEIDSRIGFIRGTLREYQEIEKAEFDEIEAFLNGAYE
ncbi:ATP-binding protein [Spironucleus salmonicida]|uniref:GPN-loop GTPase 2 n=1 Tax=Spironucleus salmonicida TaxID=348837 RepID=V6LAA6_9EUKA|nr:ATP-binding protein [Spironucleus salmonicida]|eukprot:EST41370.1 ATP-binding protein [Spironucleus salmonicida]